jgi:hypothetical protein
VVRREWRWSWSIMGWLLLEALGAGAILLAIVWWTMFSGRRKGERQDDDAAH